MDFRQATDAISAGVSQQDLADKLGVNVQRIRQARLDPSADGYRPPPAGWQSAVVQLAQDRGEAFLDIAQALANYASE